MCMRPPCIIPNRTCKYKIHIQIYNSSEIINVHRICYRIMLTVFQAKVEIGWHLATLRSQNMHSNSNERWCCCYLGSGFDRGCRFDNHISKVTNVDVEYWGRRRANYKIAKANWRGQTLFKCDKEFFIQGKTENIISNQIRFKAFQRNKKKERKKKPKKKQLEFLNENVFRSRFAFCIRPSRCLVALGLPAQQTLIKSIYKWLTWKRSRERKQLSNNRTLKWTERWTKRRERQSEMNL